MLVLYLCILFIVPYIFLIFLWLLVPWDLGCAAEIWSSLQEGTPALMLALLIIQQAPEGGNH